MLKTFVSSPKTFTRSLRENFITLLFIAVYIIKL